MKAEFGTIDQAEILEFLNALESQGGLLIQGPHIKNNWLSQIMATEDSSEWEQEFIPNKVFKRY